ncbi:hypothetical protein F443_15410 [Phytophthora nicotianae P1569]|uniref:PiggyBac transposable element-derived protein domain-containing protein n=1 Tax=Phytophthora nicotianae P1569 TaxID=1317065 RepID=V9EIB9_PHYNI|nr:hypothetical protein F443_15410 [Phytophthora nicotianae P1569]
MPRDCEVTARDLSFKSVWRELKKDGWTQKPPPGRSLDDRYFYMPPGKNVKGSEGVDYFRDEQTLLEHYSEGLVSMSNTCLLLVELRRRAVGVQPSAPGADQLAAAAAVVRENHAADIEAAEARARAPTSAQPVPADQATNVVPPNPASTSATRPQSPAQRAPTRRSLINTAIPMANSPAGGTQPRSPLIPTSPHVQDADYSSEEADKSDNNSDGESTYPAETPTRNDDADEDGEDSAFGSELLADIIDDLNVVVNHAIEHQFGKLDSGDEAEADDMETGECVSDEEVEIYCVSDGIGDDPVATKDEITAEALFAENFLDSFGDEDEDLAENLKNAVLCEMSANGWEDVVEPDTIEYMHGPYDPVNNTSSYPSLRQGYSGPTADVLRRGDSPIGLFLYFLPVVLWQHIAACSTEYHREMLPRRLGETFQRYRRKRRLNPQLPRKTRRDIQHKLEGMKPVLPHEMCQFVGLLVARTVVPNREKLASQWKTTAEGAMSRGCFGSVLTRN